MSTKNKTPKSFNEIDISLYHLIFLGNLIENTCKAFENIIGKVEEKDENALWVSTCSISIIHTISFLDEFDNFIKSDDEILQIPINKIKKAVKPALDQIRKWKELRSFRNNVLAHNLRDKKIAASVFQRGLNSYDIPKTGADLAVLYSCISMIKKTFESAFKVKLLEIQDIINQQKLPGINNHFNSGKDVKEVISRITDEINANILKLKSEYES